MVLLGGNDYLNRKPKKEIFANLRIIITTIQDSGAVVLLLGIRGGLFYDSFDDDFEDAEVDEDYMDDLLVLKVYD